MGAREDTRIALALRQLKLISKLEVKAEAEVGSPKQDVLLSIIIYSHGIGMEDHITSRGNSNPGLAPSRIRCTLHLQVRS